MRAGIRARTGDFYRWGAAAVGVVAVTVSSQAQGTLVSGETAEGAISVAGERDTWTFTATVGDSIVVRAGEVNETGGTGGFTPGIELYGPAGGLLASEVANLNATEVSVTATAAGDYSVVIMDGGSYDNGTGTYRLHLARVPGAISLAPGDEGGPLENGGTVVGTIHQGDLDVFSFTAAVGDSLVLRAGEVTDQGGTGGFTPALRLYGPGGSLLDSEAANLSAVEVTATATLAGVYVVVVSDGGSYIDGAGTYRLHLMRSPGEFLISPGDEGGELANGATQVGTVHVGDLDVWTFTAAVGDSIVARAGEVTEESGTGGFTPALRLYGPNGSLLDSESANLNAVEVGVTASIGGSYTLVVSDGGSYIDGAGSYRVHLAKAPGDITVSPGDEGGPLTNGGTFTGSVHQGDLDVWTFTAATGDSLVVRAGEVTDAGGTGGFTPALRLYGPNGSLLDSDAGNVNAVEVNATAAQSGVYAVVVSDGGSYIDGSGTYRLHLVQSPGAVVVSAGDEGGPLASGGLYLGTIHMGDLDAWTFTAAAGDRILVRAGESTENGGTGGFTPALRLYGPNGGLLGNEAGNVNAVEIEATAAQSGVFNVVVSDGGSYADGAGTYYLNLALMPETPVVSAGDQGGPLARTGPDQGDIARGDLDIWWLEANAGDHVALTLTESIDTGGTGGFTPWLRVYGPQGQLLGSDADNTRAEVDFTATDSCLYLVVVADGGSYLDGTGAYQIVATGLPVQGRPLRAQRTGAEMLRLCWPSAMADYLLETNTQLQPEGWEVIALTPADTGLNRSLLLPVGIGNQFYRLRPPQ